MSIHNQKTLQEFLQDLHKKHFPDTDFDPTCITDNSHMERPHCVYGYTCPAQMVIKGSYSKDDIYISFWRGIKTVLDDTDLFTEFYVMKDNHILEKKEI